MLVMTKKRYVRVAVSFAAFALLSAVFGNSCSGFRKSSKIGIGSSTSLCTGAGREIKFTPGKETVSVVYGRQALDNMQACLGVATLSQNTLDEYNARRASFSEFGYIGDITPPMMMGIAALATQVCDDLVDQEANGNRRIFNQIDFTGGSSVDGNDVSDVSRRMSRACLGRDDLPEETLLIQDAISGIQSDGNQNAQTMNRLIAVSICSAILSSLDGIRM